jgi:hypothetical protein
LRRCVSVTSEVSPSFETPSALTLHIHKCSPDLARRSSVAGVQGSRRPGVNS